MLLSSHLLHQVQQVCDRIAIFVAGEVVAMGTVARAGPARRRGANVALEVGADGRRSRPSRTSCAASPGVITVEPDDRDDRLLVATGAAAIRAGVADGPRRRRACAVALRDRGMELDEIYQRYFTGTSIPPSHRTRAAAGALPDVATTPTTPRRRTSAPTRRRQIHRSNRKPPSQGTN